MLMKMTTFITNSPFYRLSFQSVQFSPKYFYMQQEKDKEDPQRDKVLGDMVGKYLRQNSVERIVEGQ